MIIAALSNKYNFFAYFSIKFCRKKIITIQVETKSYNNINISINIKKNIKIYIYLFYINSNILTLTKSDLSNKIKLVNATIHIILYFI